MLFPDELRYHEAHMWVRADGTKAVVGLSDYAQSEMGDIIYVELTDEGETVEAGDSLGNVESAKTVEDLIVPVGGTITSVNNEVVDAPEMINEDPYGDGWLAEIEMADDTLPPGLTTAADYERYVAELGETEEEEEGFDFPSEDEA
jgi:glycine cleavage system H protein